MLYEIVVRGISYVMTCRFIISIYTVVVVTCIVIICCRCNNNIGGYIILTSVRLFFICLTCLPPARVPMQTETISFLDYCCSCSMYCSFFKRHYIIFVWRKLQNNLITGYYGLFTRRPFICGKNTFTPHFRPYIYKIIKV